MFFQKNKIYGFQIRWAFGEKILVPIHQPGYNTFINRQTLRCIQNLKNGYSYKVKSQISGSRLGVPFPKNGPSSYVVFLSNDRSKAYLISDEHLYVFNRSDTPENKEYVLLDLGKKAKTDPALKYWASHFDGRIAYGLDDYGITLEDTADEKKHLKDEEWNENQKVNYEKPVSDNDPKSIKSLNQILKDSVQSYIDGIKLYNSELSKNTQDSESSRQKWRDNLVVELQNAHNSKTYMTDEERNAVNSSIDNLLKLDPEELFKRFQNYFKTQNDPEIKNLHHSRLCYAVNWEKDNKPEYCETDEWQTGLGTWDSTQKIIDIDKTALKNCAEDFKMLPEQGEIFKKGVLELSEIENSIGTDDKGSSQLKSAH